MRRTAAMHMLSCVTRMASGTQAARAARALTGSSGTSSSLLMAAAQQTQRAYSGMGRALCAPGSLALHGYRMAQQALPASATAQLPAPAFTTSTCTAISSTTSVSGTASATGGELQAAGGEAEDEGVKPLKRKHRSLQITQHSHLPRGSSWGACSGAGIASYPWDWLLVRSLSTSCLSMHTSAAAVQPAAQPPAADDADASTAAAMLTPEQWRHLHDIRVSVGPGAQVPAPLLSFDDPRMPKKLTSLMKKAGFKQPTPIQSQAWPIAVQGQDIIAISSTGSGKTAGYLMPAMARILMGHLKLIKEGSPRPDKIVFHKYPSRQSTYAGPLVLVLAPTRELCRQIQEQAELFGSPLDVRSTALYGGVSKRPQQSALRSLHPDIVVATPGRLLDLVDMQALPLDNVQYLVLDEADRMLDMGFEQPITDIVRMLPQHPTRQTCFFSATWPQEVRSLAGRLSGGNPASIFVGRVSDQPVAARTIAQEVVLVEGTRDKWTALKQHLLQVVGDGPHQRGALGRRHHRGSGSDASAQRVLVFCATKSMADAVSDWINDQSDLPRSHVLHGDVNQAAREYRLKDFTSGQVQILVATDVAARGLDIPHVASVVNFDLPDPGRSEDYVHRIGRTGRAGAAGRSLAMFDRRKDRYCAEYLVKILKEADQRVPEELQDIAASMHQSQHHSNRSPSRGSRGYGGRGHSAGGYGSRGRSGGGYQRSPSSVQWGRYDGRSKEGAGGYGSRGSGYQDQFDDGDEYDVDGGYRSSSRRQRRQGREWDDEGTFDVDEGYGAPRGRRM